MDLDEAQQLAAEIDRMLSRKGKKPRSPFVICTDILEEAGEVASIIKGFHGMKKVRLTKKHLGDELADLLYSILWLANTYKIRLNEHYREKIMAYLKKYGR